MRINLAGLITLIMVISLSSAVMAWLYAPPRTGERLSARYYQLQQQHQTLHDRLATLNGEFTLARAQVEGLKHELLSSQKHNESLKQKLNIYVSILNARKSGGVRILRAAAHMQDYATLDYSLALVKGGNYPRSVSGSIRIIAFGDKGQKLLLRLGKDTDVLPYHMDTHIFLEGEIPWRQHWQPSMLRITRINLKGEERDQMTVKLRGDAVGIHVSKQVTTTEKREVNDETWKKHGK